MSTLLLWLMVDLRRWLLVGVLLTASFIGVAFGQSIASAWHLADEAVPTTGTVVQVGNPVRREGVEYRYSAAGRTWSGYQVGGGTGNPPQNQLRAGDPVVVYVLPQEPGVSYLGDPHRGLGDRLASAAAFSGVLFLGWLSWRRKVLTADPRPL